MKIENKKLDFYFNNFSSEEKEIVAHGSKITKAISLVEKLKLLDKHDFVIRIHDTNESKEPFIRISVANKDN